MLGTPPGETDSLTQARGSGVRIGEVNQERADTVAQSGGHAALPRVFLTVMHVVCKAFPGRRWGKVTGIKAQTGNETTEIY